jgi:hypothetical protein
MRATLASVQLNSWLQRRIVQLEEFKPENELEYAIVDAREGVRPVADLKRLIARSNLFMSSKGEVQSDGSGFDPLLFDKDGHPFVAAGIQKALHHDDDPAMDQPSGTPNIKYGCVLDLGVSPSSARESSHG